MIWPRDFFCSCLVCGKTSGGWGRVCPSPCPHPQCSKLGRRCLLQPPNYRWGTGLELRPSRKMSSNLKSSVTNPTWKEGWAPSSFRSLATRRLLGQSDYVLTHVGLWYGILKKEWGDQSSSFDTNRSARFFFKGSRSSPVEQGELDWMKGAESSRRLDQLSGVLLWKSLCMYMKLVSLREPQASVGDVYLLTKLSLIIARNLHNGKVGYIWPAGPHQPWYKKFIKIF